MRCEFTKLIADFMGHLIIGHYNRISYEGGKFGLDVIITSYEA